MYAKFNQAIQDTVADYNLAPPEKSFAAEAEPMSRTSDWAPKFSELETFDWSSGHWRPRNEKELADEKARNGGVVGGRTWDDGRISIYRKAFEGRDGLELCDGLAATIVHETSHWAEVAARQGHEASPSETYGGEVQAYTKESAFLEANGLADGGTLRLLRKFREEQTAAKGHDWDWVIAYHKRDWLDVPDNRTPPMPDFVQEDVPSPEAIKKNGESDFADAGNAAAGQDASDEMKAEQLKAKADEARRNFAIMRDVVASGCQEQGQMRSSEIQRFGAAWHAAWADLDWLKQNANGAADVSEDSIYDGLSGCELKLMKDFAPLLWGERYTLPDIVQQAIEDREGIVGHLPSAQPSAEEATVAPQAQQATVRPDFAQSQDILKELSLRFDRLRSEVSWLCYDPATIDKGYVGAFANDWNAALTCMDWLRQHNYDAPADDAVLQGLSGCELDMMQKLTWKLGGGRAMVNEWILSASDDARSVVARYQNGAAAPAVGCAGNCTAQRPAPLPPKVQPHLGQAYHQAEQWR